MAPAPARAFERQRRPSQGWAAARTKTRAELLHETATGIVDAEIDAGHGLPIAEGHRIEACPPTGRTNHRRRAFPLSYWLAMDTAPASDGLTLIGKYSMGSDVKTPRAARRHPESSLTWKAAKGLPEHYRAQL